ncbi:MAG TPA: universal stress protein [Myxococcota bacterium]|nr:universal stress protein [Myxococcota bacterium]
MSWINRILVPIDLSPCSAAALSYAVFLAEHSGARLYVLHVCEDEAVPGGATEGIDLTTLSRGRARKEIADLLKAIPSAVARGATVQVADGDPIRAIVQCARQECVDLIVMGKYGDKHTEASHTGNVTAGVAAKAPCGVIPVFEPAIPGATFALAAAGANDSWGGARHDDTAWERVRPIPLHGASRRGQGGGTIEPPTPLRRRDPATSPQAPHPPRWQPH